MTIDQEPSRPLPAYYDGLNEKLLSAIPSRRKVLELGCAGGRLGAAYKQAHPETTWVGVDLDRDALVYAAQRLDAVHHMNLDTDPIQSLGSGFDCIVFGDLIEHVKSPERLLQALSGISTEDAMLICCVPNMGHISVLERMLLGDLSYEAAGLLDRTHLRFFSPPALCKNLLDAGWLPTQHDTIAVQHPNLALLKALLDAAVAIHVPRKTALLSLITYQVVVRCSKSEQTHPIENSSRVSVLVAVNDETQFALNVLASPGLREIDAGIVPCIGAANAAEAFEQGRARATGDWLLYCHQDVYFPKGGGYRIAQRLAGISAEQAPAALLGFAGLSLHASGALQRSGLAVDRHILFDHPSSQTAISLDELAVLLHRETRYRLDPALGWHTWATDLCLQALYHPDGGRFAEILRVPVHHNSVSDHTLPASYHASARQLAAKYPQLDGIATLCEVIPGVHQISVQKNESSETKAP